MTRHSVSRECMVVVLFCRLIAVWFSGLADIVEAIGEPTVPQTLAILLIIVVCKLLCERTWPAPTRLTCPREL